MFEMIGMLCVLGFPCSFEGARNSSLYWNAANKVVSILRIFIHMSIFIYIYTYIYMYTSSLPGIPWPPFLVDWFTDPPHFV